jgi:hypothetical protein
MLMIKKLKTLILVLSQFFLSKTEIIKSFMLSITIPGVILLSVIIPNVVILNVVAPPGKSTKTTFISAIRTQRMNRWCQCHKTFYVRDF